MFGLLSLLVVGIAGEVFLRIKYDEQLKLETYPQIFTPDSTYGYLYQAGANSRICVPGIDKEVHINERGYYGSSFTVKKSPGTYRIAIVGVSEATGIWMENDNIFSKQLQERFQQEGYKVEVINCSIDGRYRDMTNIERVRWQVSEYEPDLVLLGTQVPFAEGKVFRDQYKGYVIIYGEGKYSRINCERKIDYITQHKLLIFMYKASFIVRAACRKYRFTYPEKRYAQNLEIFTRNRMQALDVGFRPLASNTAAEALLELEDCLAEENRSLFIFYYHRDTFNRELAGMYGFPYLPLDVGKSPELVGDLDAHYNEIGHAEIASQLFDSLVARESIPLEYGPNFTGTAQE